MAIGTVARQLGPLGAHYAWRRDKQRDGSPKIGRDIVCVVHLGNVG